MIDNLNIILIIVCTRKTEQNTSNPKSITSLQPSFKMDQVAGITALKSMPDEARTLIQSVAPELMRLAGMEGFVVDLDEDYISLTGELRRNTINDKILPHFFKGEHFITEKVVVGEQNCMMKIDSHLILN